MRKLILLLLSVVGVGILAQPAAAQGTVVFSDNFNAFRVAALSIRTVDLLHGAVIERYNRGIGDNAPNLFNYKAWIDVPLNTSPAVAWAATTHTTGKFRIARSGGLRREPGHSTTRWT